MGEWIAPLLLVLAVIVVLMAARRWLWRRWPGGGMSATRVAFLSVAITYVPLLAGLVTWGWISGRAISPGNWLIIGSGLLLPAAMGFGLRRAVFEYMERYVIRDRPDRGGPGRRRAGH